MTPAELNEFYDAKAGDRARYLEIFDRMNAKTCHIMAIAGKVEIDGRQPREDDFYVIAKRQPEQEQTEDEYNRSLDLWAIATKGKRR